jgi:hypothetical protein
MGIMPVLGAEKIKIKNRAGIRKGSGWWFWFVNVLLGPSSADLVTK